MEIKDPADLVEKPLHLLGLHHDWAMAAAFLLVALLGAGLLLWWRRRPAAV
jgi:uncharacterized iron-regulated membrane protein